tara:strand:- start:55 stop:276 length:222 start_codon:yes stop_codon:yes gene_type:complete
MKKVFKIMMMMTKDEDKKTYSNGSRKAANTSAEKPTMDSTPYEPLSAYTTKEDKEKKQQEMMASFPTMMRMVR